MAAFSTMLRTLPRKAFRMDTSPLSPLTSGRRVEPERAEARSSSEAVVMDPAVTVRRLLPVARLDSWNTPHRQRLRNCAQGNRARRPTALASHGVAVNSVIVLPAGRGGADLRAAHDFRVGVERGERHSFEVSTDAGATWVQAQIASRELDHPWHRFALD